jgi:uncharacterized protein YndB with AHSA1/START domain
MIAPGNASYTHENGAYTMTFERRFTQPIARVWAALTEPDQLAKWFYPLQGTLAVGESIVIPWDDAGLHSTIVAYEAPRLLAWTWHQPGEPESIVRWELFEDGAATRFVLTHTLPVLSANEPTDTLAGWHTHLDTLVDAMAGTERGWSHAAWRTLKDRYAFAVEKAQLPDDRGIIETLGDRTQVHFARIFNAPLEKVWAAISTSEGLSGWFTETSIDAREGGSITMTFPGHGTWTYPVVKVEPPRVLEFQFDDDAENIVRFELFDGGSETLSVLTNRFGAPTLAEDHRVGWHYHLDRLPSYLTGELDPRGESHHASVEQIYDISKAAI